jgi:hypothetical protein
LLTTSSLARIVANSKLDKGLKACRAIVSNYRALIAGRVGADPPHPPSKRVKEDR